jgi:hypothetical protein
VIAATAMTLQPFAAGSLDRVRAVNTPLRWFRCVAECSKSVVDEIDRASVEGIDAARELRFDPRMT